MDTGQYPGGGGESGGGNGPMNKKMIRIDLLYRKLTGFIWETQVTKGCASYAYRFLRRGESSE